MAKSTEKSDRPCKKASQKAIIEKACYKDIVQFVDNLFELAKLQSTLLSHLQKTVNSFQAK